jgi:type II secretory pathway component GspD/PulD (secretin)
MARRADARGRAFAVALTIACALATAPAAADSQVYRPAHRLAGELLPIAEAALAGEGSVVADEGTNSLVLVGPRPALARTLELLAQQDRALRNVVVHYETRRVGDLEAEGVRVAWQVDTGSVRVGNVVLPRPGTAVVVRPEAGGGREQGTQQGMLRVLEGQTGRIASGVEVPVVSRRWTRFGVEESVGTVQADSGLDVTPRVMGDGRVRLELAPFDARVAGAHAAGPVVARSGAQTSVSVAPGEKVVVGSLARGATTTSGDVFSGAARSRASEENVLVVWVEID